MLIQENDTYSGGNFEYLKEVAYGLPTESLIGDGNSTFMLTVSRPLTVPEAFLLGTVGSGLDEILENQTVFKLWFD